MLMVRSMLRKVKLNHQKEKRKSKRINSCRGLRKIGRYLLMLISAYQHTQTPKSESQTCVNFR